jgi:hypothetical protein
VPERRIDGSRRVPAPDVPVAAHADVSHGVVVRRSSPIAAGRSRKPFAL